MLSTLIALVVVAAAAYALYLLARFLLRRVTVFEFERGLRYDRGRFTRVLEPGQYWVFRPNTTVRTLDVRPTFVTIPGQEVLTADNVTLKLSLAAEYAIVDPAVAVNEVDDYASALYLTIQVALRELVSTAPVDHLLEHRGEIGARLHDTAAPKARELGLELRSVEIKDVMFPGDLKRVFAQVVAAQKEGLAALERARGETAALRNLANAARMIESNPALLQLRLVQQLGASGGNTVVLGVPSSTTPLPLREGPDASTASELPPHDE